MPDLSTDELKANIDKANDIIVALKRRCDRAENENILLQAELAHAQRELEKSKTVAKATAAEGALVSQSNGDARPSAAN